jgi:predicted transcriptional regulator
MAQTAEHKTASKKASSKCSSATDEIKGKEIEPDSAAQSARQEYPEVKAAIERGLADVAAGRIYTRQSYAKYADIEIED